MSSCSAESEVDITGVVAAEEEDDEIDAKTTAWLAYIRSRVSQGRNRVSVSGDHLVHGHRGQHLQPDRRARRLDALDGFA